MTCRCATQAEHEARYRTANDEANLREAERKRAEAARIAAATSTTNYIVEQAEKVGEHLVMQVRYPACEHREFEGLKTMVFLGVTAMAALRWKSIDPHFRAQATKTATEAPSPAARFPGTKDGWADAIAYAQGKRRP